MGRLPPYLAAVGVFGIVITVGLFFYELRGMQLCRFYIARGEKIEWALGIQEEGLFTKRPRGAFLMPSLAQTAAYIIYSTVLAAWVYVAVLGLLHAKSAPEQFMESATFYALLVWIALIVLSFVAGPQVVGTEGKSSEDGQRGTAQRLESSGKGAGGM